MIAQIRLCSTLAIEPQGKDYIVIRLLENNQVIVEQLVVQLTCTDALYSVLFD